MSDKPTARLSHTECMEVHIKPAVEALGARGICIWSEHGESPDGWVNIHCTPCGNTHQVSIQSGVVEVE